MVEFYTLVPMKYTEEVLEDAVKQSFSISEVLRKLGIAGGGSHGHITWRIKQLGIDTSHFKKQGEFLKKSCFQKKPWQEVLVLKPSSQRTPGFQLKRALLEIGREYKCENIACSIQGKWLERKLVLDVDHIDGNWHDNRSENLRFLCPNCHSQTETYGNKYRRLESRNYIPHMNKKVPHIKARKVERPSQEELRKMVWEKPTTHIAKELDVSDKAVEKWCKAYGIEKPPRGYWAKRNQAKTSMSHA